MVSSLQWLGDFQSDKLGAEVASYLEFFLFKSDKGYIYLHFEFNRISMFNIQVTAQIILDNPAG